MVEKQRKGRAINTLDIRRQVILWPLAVCVRLWARTLRFEIAERDEALLRDVSVPTLVLFWHNRLFLAAEGYRRFRAPKPMYGLVSASRDGAWLAAFFRLMGLYAVRGSSSRRGREAISELISRLYEGADVTITPDGPRGPMYSFKPGPAMVARRARARVLLVGTSFGRAWRLKSWDRFVLPKPFSKVQIHCATVEAGELGGTFEEAAATLRSRLEELNTDPEE